MKYFRCKCGKYEAWSSMGVASCNTCSSCGSTLAEGPEGHVEPRPHSWVTEWQIDPKTGYRWQERVCTACLKREKLEVVDAPEAR